MWQKTQDWGGQEESWQRSSVDRAQEGHREGRWRQTSPLWGGTKGWKEPAHTGVRAYSPTAPTQETERKEKHCHCSVLLSWPSRIPSHSAPGSVLIRFVFKTSQRNYYAIFKGVSGNLSPENILACLQMSKEKSIPLTSRKPWNPENNKSVGLRWPPWDTWAPWTRLQCLSNLSILSKAGNHLLPAGWGLRKATEKKTSQTPRVLLPFTQK